MKTSILLFATLVIALISITEAATVSRNGPTRSRANAFRQRSRQLRKRQFADNSQLINIEQNGDLFKFFSTTTNLGSPRGRTNSPGTPANGLFGGLSSLLQPKPLK